MKGGGRKHLTTLNVASWGTGAGHVAEALKQAQVAAIQEHKLTALRISEVSGQMARKGLKWLGSPAVTTDKGGLSSGVAIVCQGTSDVWHGGRCSELYPGRLCHAFVRTPELGLTAIYSVYLVTGTGLVGPNVAILECLVDHVTCHRLPWIAVGDINMDPAEIQKAEWVQRLRVCVMAPNVCHVPQ